MAFETKNGLDRDRQGYVREWDTVRNKIAYSKIKWFMGGYQRETPKMWANRLRIYEYG